MGFHGVLLRNELHYSQGLQLRAASCPGPSWSLYLWREVGDCFRTVCYTHTSSGTLLPPKDAGLPSAGALMWSFLPELVNCFGGGGNISHLFIVRAQPIIARSAHSAAISGPSVQVCTCLRGNQSQQKPSLCTLFCHPSVSHELLYRKGL